MRFQPFVRLIAISLLAGACSNDPLPTVPESVVHAAGTAGASSIENVVVDPGNMNGWYFWNDKDDIFTGSPGELVSGPVGQPMGTGSVRLGPLTDNGATGAGHSVIATNAYFGTPLSTITGLSYSSYQPGPTLAIAIQFDVKYRTTDAAYGGRLVFEPYQNGSGTVGAGWQSWSPLAGKWWATKTTVAGTGGVQVVALPTGNCGQATPCTWAEIAAAFPDASIGGRFLLKAGSNWFGFDGNADAVSITISGNTTTYDFEPTQFWGACAVDINGSTYTLLSDCVTDQTLSIPTGVTLDGNGYSITAVDPAGGHFLGAVIRNAGASASVRNVTVTAQGLANVCDAGNNRLRGILFEGASGSISNSTVTNVNQGPSGCQEGNAIEARNAPFDNTGSDLDVIISGNTVNGYIKNGITANGSVAASITNNVVTGNGPLGVPLAAQNGIQIGFGATAIVKGNTITGNDYTPKSYVACGLLLYQADGVKASSNPSSGNEKDLCNYGKGGGTFNPEP